MTRLSQPDHHSALFANEAAHRRFGTCLEGRYSRCPGAQGRVLGDFGRISTLGDSVSAGGQRRFGSG
ncbi:hypothetical protein CSUI_007105 [Cystoisospora suis]|uniref:Uncharacterized protein n=1 Tax=Cystoisospora suis TaxID=483139 RepID=A0A2C6KS45_9APIC|nr:hypothetical protein CSUI_007105 [Cystoisospora suis]